VVVHRAAALCVPWGRSERAPPRVVGGIVVSELPPTTPAPGVVVVVARPKLLVVGACGHHGGSRVSGGGRQLALAIAKGPSHQLGAPAVSKWLLMPMGDAPGAPPLSWENNL